MQFSYKFCFFLFLFLWLCSFSFAQKHNWYISPEYGVGVILKHNDRLGHLIKSNPNSIGLSIGKKLTKESSWAHRFQYPKIQYGLAYHDLRNEVLGELFAASVALEIPAFSIRDFSVSYQIGTGLVYCTNPYDRVENNQNTMISSTLTYLMQAKLSFNYHAFENLSVNAKVDFTHASNASVSRPNRGINIASASLGLSYRFAQMQADTEENIPHREEKQSEREWFYDISLGAGIADNTPGFEKGKPFANVYFDAVRTLNTKSDVEIGLQYFHSLAMRRAVRHNWFQQENEEELDFRRIGISLGHALKLGDLSVITALGYYLYNKTEYTPLLYQRLGLEYQVINNLRLGFMMKSHRGVAEFGEFLISWRI